MFRQKLIIGFFCFFSSLLLTSQDIQFPSWEEGVLEIHHIHTGRGNAAFFIFPDATTMLVDAGDMSETHPRTLSHRNTSLKPNRSKTAPQWIVNYIEQFFPKGYKKQLDYALITHYHDDHFGETDSTRIFSKKGNYALTGIMEVGHLIPIQTLLDRGSSFPISLKDLIVQKRLSENDPYQMINTLNEYWKFSEYHGKQSGLKHQTLLPGSLNQINLTKNRNKYSNFSIRNIAVNGQIWTGENENYFSLYKEGEYPGENPLSTCIKISYGSFDYFTGGDVSGINEFGDADFHSIESHIAPVIGPVDVATLNHHGNRDSQNTFYVRALRPRVWIGQTWSSDHPDNNVLRRILSEKLHPGERDVFSTAMLQPNKDVIGGLINRYKSLQGHVVVRVYNEGDSYDVYILNADSGKREVIAKYGPYESR